jgi:hypothetical protein
MGLAALPGGLGSVVGDTLCCVDDGGVPPRVSSGVVCLLGTSVDGSSGPGGVRVGRAVFGSVVVCCLSGLGLGAL